MYIIVHNGIIENSYKINSKIVSSTRFSLNVLIGIIHDNLVGPYFLPRHFNTESYEILSKRKDVGAVGRRASRYTTKYVILVL